MCGLRVQRENMADLSVIIRDHATLLMEAMITLAFLAAHYSVNFIRFVVSKKQNLEGDFVETWGTGFSLHLLPFVNFFPLNFVPGSGPRIHDIDNKYYINIVWALTMCQVLCEVLYRYCFI